MFISAPIHSLYMQFSDDIKETLTSMISGFQANEVSKEHTKKLAATEKKLVMVRAKLQQTNDEKEILKNDLQRSQNRLTEQDEDIRNLNRQLQIQQQQSNDINEHLLIKDAEV